MVMRKVKWYSEKGRFYSRKELKELKKMKSKPVGKYSKSYYRLDKRVKLLKQPSVVAVSTTGINMKTRDVQAYMKKHKLTESAGVIRRG